MKVAKTNKIQVALRAPIPFQKADTKKREGTTPKRSRHTTA